MVAGDLPPGTSCQDWGHRTLVVQVRGSSEQPWLWALSSGPHLKVVSGLVLLLYFEDLGGQGTQKREIRLVPLKGRSSQSVAAAWPSYPSAAGASVCRLVLALLVGARFGCLPGEITLPSQKQEGGSLAPDSGL